MFVLAYLATQDVNVVAVDWSEVADKLYVKARMGVVPVGKFLAQVLDWLVLEAGVSIDKVHIVGHSLGAHIAGTTGEHITVGNLSRITGTYYVLLTSYCYFRFTYTYNTYIKYQCVKLINVFLPELIKVVPLTSVNSVPCTLLSLKPPPS